MSQADSEVNDRRDLPSKSLDEFSKEDLEELRGMRWSEEDREQFSLPSLDALPLHLRFLDYGISTQGFKHWVKQGNIVIPGSSVVQLYAGQGALNVGVPQGPVTVTGHFSDGTVQGPAGGGFPRPGWNKFCMAVASPSIAFYNTSIPNWGASGTTATSPTDYWVVGVNNGGQCEVACNDDVDRDNRGSLAMIIRITQASDFALMNEYRVGY